MIVREGGPAEPSAADRLNGFRKRLRGWHQHQAHDAQRDGRAADAARHLDYITRAKPIDESDLPKRAWTLLRVGRVSEALADFARVIESKKDDPAPWLDRALAYATEEDWDRAAADYVQAVALGANDAHIHHQQACLCLLRKDPEGANKIGMSLLDRFREKMEPDAGYIGVRICALVPKPSIDLKELAKFAESAFGASPEPPWLAYTLGLAYYRAARYEDAARQFQRSLDANPDWWPSRDLNWLGLAIAKKRLGQTDEAIADLAKADRWFEERSKKDPPLHPSNLLEFHVLRREAAALGLKTTPPKGK